jgi:hypothetical protein
MRRQLGNQRHQALHVMFIDTHLRGSRTHTLLLY